MNTTNKSPNPSLLPSDLTPKQLESLTFVPGTLNNFDEKEHLPPTTRPQWAYVQQNPAEYLERFTNELGLGGINIALCFINREAYEDKAKDLKTPITVNLVVHPGQFEEVSDHFSELGLSHQRMENQKGFLLPYLGSIQKMLDALDLPKLVNYVFIKNSISRETYYNWISIPKKLLDPKPPGKAKPEPVPGGQKRMSGTVQGDAERKSNSHAPLPLPSASRKKDAPKENFNYVIYDEKEAETRPPIPAPAPEAKNNGVIVAAKPPPSRKNRLSAFTTGFKSKRGKDDSSESVKPVPTALFDALLFFCLGLFNFYCSFILLTFLAGIVEAINAIMPEAVTLSALAAMLFAFLVIRPSLRNPKSRLWSLAAYGAFFTAAGYRIFVTSNQPDPSGYLVPTAITVVCLMGALLAAFMRIDRMSLRQSAGSKSARKEHKPGAKEENKSGEQPVDKPERDLPGAKLPPPPMKPKGQKEEQKKIQLKPASSNGKKQAPEDSTKSATPHSASANRRIPLKPISEEQKEVIRNRLARKDLNNLHPVKEDIPASERKDNGIHSDGQKQLSAAEIRVKLAERLKQTRAANNTLTGSSKPEDPLSTASSDPSSSAKQNCHNLETSSGIPDSNTEAEPGDGERNTQVQGDQKKKIRLSLPKD